MPYLASLSCSLLLTSGRFSEYLFYLVISAHYEYSRFMFFQFFLVHHAIDGYDDLVTEICQPGSSTVNTDNSTTPLSLYGVSSKSGSITHIIDLYLFKRLDSCLIKQVHIYRQAARIIEFRLCYCGTMYFRNKSCSEHITSNYLTYLPNFLTR